MKKAKSDNHYYFATASKICTMRQTKGIGFVPINFDKKSAEYSVIIEKIAEARKSGIDPIYIPRTACKLYFDELLAPTQPAEYPMIEGEGAPQYTFALPAEPTQLALL